MSKESNNQGRAYEYICINKLNKEINKLRKAKIESNSAYIADERAWNLVNDELQSILSKSAEAVVSTIFEMEPKILENDEEILKLRIQTDNEGKAGDVRDIIISRSNIKWEIGLSIKHNHFTVKHSRLAKNLDFGKKWFNVPCSPTYWEEIRPIFAMLEKLKLEKKKWSEILSKDKDVYIPLLTAFKKEILKSYRKDNLIPRKMVGYLLGEFDFYKVISVDSKKFTRIQSYNIHGDLNLPSKTIKPKIFIPIVELPTRIVSFDFKPNSSNTLELYMDCGWQFSFRIHNADKFVIPSLKFDIQVIGMPATILTIDCLWCAQK